MARQDYAVTDAQFGVTRAQTLARTGEIAASVDVPVNADLEAGYGDSPDAVAETVRLAIDLGLAGGNIEDKKPLSDTLYEEGLAVERIRAARAAISASARSFVLTARSDALLFPKSGVDGAIRRSNLYLAAGADCAFTPGTVDLATIRQLAAGIEGPLNMVLGLGTLEGNALTWREAGVQRVSLGGTFARAALGFVREGAKELMQHGTIRFADVQIPQAELNALFAAR